MLSEVPKLFFIFRSLFYCFYYCYPYPFLFGNIIQIFLIFIKLWSYTVDDKFYFFIFLFLLAGFTSRWGEKWILGVGVAYYLLLQINEINSVLLVYLV